MAADGEILRLGNLQHPLPGHHDPQQQQYSVPFKSDHYQQMLTSQSEEQQLKHCKLCSYVTPHACNLKRHMLYHTGEKPFSCEFCPYRCAERNNLRKHLLVHTGAKPFKCLYCGYRANIKSNVRKHVASQHENRDLTNVDAMIEEIRPKLQE